MGRIPDRYIVGAGAGLAVLIVVACVFIKITPRHQPSPPVVVASSPPKSTRSPLPNLPIEMPTGGYVGSAACQNCHPNQHGSWHESYHRTMTQVASDESVLGDFNNVRLSGRDMSVRLFKEDGRFKVEMSLNHSTTTRVYTVVMTTGSHNRQAYWLADPRDPQLMLLPYMYLRADQRWIPRPSAYIRKLSQADSSELIAFRGEKGRWPLACIRCHATHGQSSPVDEAGHRLGSPRVAEFGISCEACHGPGEVHIQAMREPFARNKETTGIVNPAKLPHDRSAQVCGQCHAVFFPRSEEAHYDWLKNGNPYRPGDDLFADPIRYVMRGRPELMPDRPDHIPDPAETGSFWPDGMSRATGREFSGLIESPCYQRGSMSCLSCHEMHQHSGDTRTPAEWAAGQLKPGMQGDRACVQCHSQFDDDAVAAQHTHHKADSSGSRCYNCHMPHTTYGLLKATRSHMVNSPSVSESLQAGRPNACNLCHQDQTLAWTAEYLSLWYKQKIPTLSADEEKIAASVIWALRGDAGQRALTAWSFGWADAQHVSGNNWQAPFLGQLLDDPHDAVRIIAHRSLKRLPGFVDFDYDFLSEPSIRSAAVLNARKVWQKTRDDRKRPFVSQTLIDSTGQILDADFQRLLRQRDDTPVEIAE
jgi:Cytochrome c554 and c-prime